MRNNELEKDLSNKLNLKNNGDQLEITEPYNGKHGYYPLELYFFYEYHNTIINLLDKLNLQQDNDYLVFKPFRSWNQIIFKYEAVVNIFKEGLNNTQLIDEINRERLQKSDFLVKLENEFGISLLEFVETGYDNNHNFWIKTKDKATIKKLEQEFCQLLEQRGYKELWRDISINFLNPNQLEIARKLVNPLRKELGLPEDEHVKNPTFSEMLASLTSSQPKSTERPSDNKPVSSYSSLFNLNSKLPESIERSSDNKPASSYSSLFNPNSTIEFSQIQAEIPMLLQKAFGYPADDFEKITSKSRGVFIRFHNENIVSLVIKSLQDELLKAGHKFDAQFWVSKSIFNPNEVFIHKDALERVHEFLTSAGKNAQQPTEPEDEAFSIANKM